MGDLTRDEFIAHIGYVREDIAGVNRRLDIQNGRIGKAEREIAILLDRGRRTDDGTADEQPQRSGIAKGKVAALSSGLAALIYAGIEAVKALLDK